MPRLRAGGGASGYHAIYPPNGKRLFGGVCDNVIEHLGREDMDRFFENAKQIFEPGGKLLVIVPGKKGFARDPTHQTFVTSELMSEVCRQHSLAIESVLYAPINSRVAGNFLYLNMALFTLVF